MSIANNSIFFKKRTFKIWNLKTFIFGAKIQIHNSARIKWFFFSILQILDIINKRCEDTNEDLSNIQLDPHVVNASGIKFDQISTSPKSFNFPTCPEGEELLVLKPHAGENSDYYVFHSGAKEMGLLQKCPKKAFKAGTNTYCFDRGFNQDEHESTVAVICGQPKTCIRTCCAEGKYLSNTGVCTGNIPFWYKTSYF